YTVYMFRTAFRPLAPGKLTLSVRWPVAFVENSFFGAEVVDERIFGGKLKTMTVKPLPALPVGMPAFCGLIGNWKWQASLNAENCKTGEPITLKLEFSGSGSAETFRAPTLDLPGFRVYPPEIKKGNVNLVSYTLIPLRDGTLPLQIGLSTFNPDTGEYAPFDFKRQIDVKKAENLVASPKTFVDASGTNDLPPQEQEANANHHRDVLYLHKNISDKTAIPLWNNVLNLCVALLLCGLIFFAASLIIMMRQKQFRDNPGLSRRHYASKQKKELLRKLKETPPEQLDSLSGDLTKYLNDVLDLPPGSGLSEAANEFNEEQTAPFAHALKTLANAAWIPGVKREFTPELKRTLIKGFTKFVIITAVFLTGTTTLSASSATAMTAYDNGKYDEALKHYAAELQKDLSHVSASLLYNMGNCYYQKGDLSRAAICYERALRLAPRNSDILVNLNLTRKKLLLAERYHLNRPGDILVSARDSLRYDEWLLVAGFAMMILLLACGLRFMEKPGWKWMALTAIPVLALAVIAASMQNLRIYSTEQAMVITHNAPVYTLPSEKNGTVGRQLKEGNEVRVMETRLDWARVRIGADEEGWIRTKDILPFWNNNMSDLIPQQPEKTK
ncbi:MAG: BatD family protein, partial [Lentisphaeria bacterium]|nr:BatD family protein [Lentisphaeria bacterium]